MTAADRGGRLTPFVSRLAQRLSFISVSPPGSRYDRGRPEQPWVRDRKVSQDQISHGEARTASAGDMEKYGKARIQNAAPRTTACASRASRLWALIKLTPPRRLKPAVTSIRATGIMTTQQVHQIGNLWLPFHKRAIVDLPVLKSFFCPF
jgi:hypothetical protein